MTVLLKKLASGSLAVGLIVVTATNAIAAPAQRESSGPMPITAPTVKLASAVTASQTPISFDRTSVSSTPAPVKEAPVVAPQYAAPAASAAPEVSTTETSQAPVAKKTTTAPTPVVVPSNSRGAGIAAAALGQLGAFQDCTALVERALRAVGIPGVGDESPASLLRFASPVVGDPQPGDLIYYSNAGAGVPHIAVYIGAGQAVHGGWNGFTTAIAPAHVGSGPSFYRVA